MSEWMDRLPPLNPLRAFEAAGRLQSIRRASEELSVTPGAVSRQVQSLETYLGVRLFRREPREVILTAEGERYLLAAVSLFPRLSNWRKSWQSTTRDVQAVAM
jgi:LysR family transcriptional regulator, glycine cleavage system transcriptional activator